MNIEKRRAEIAARKAEIRKLLTDDKNADIDALEKDIGLTEYTLEHLRKLELKLRITH